MIHCDLNRFFYFPFSDDPHFNELIRQAEIAIENGIYPERIYQVSIYFVLMTFEILHNIEKEHI